MLSPAYSDQQTNYYWKQGIYTANVEELEKNATFV